jgi:cation diffusion facilitator family transporter
MDKSARSYALLTTLTALVTIGLKLAAYLLTGSVGLFSDAAESLVNLLAALIGLWALSLAARPPDEEHAYGHFKAEYFSSGLEGALILLAAVSIGYEAWNRLFAPQPLENVSLGLGVSLVAAGINGGVAWILRRAAGRLRSIALRASSQHLLTDVWTSLGVVLGIMLVQWTGWLALDAVIALLVATNIVWAGVQLLRDTGLGLLDTALPETDQQIIAGVLQRYESRGIVFHALRTRGAGSRRFVSLHVLVPGRWSVRRGHDLCEEIELALRAELGDTSVFTHLEPLEDPLAWTDLELDRSAT